MKAGAAYVPVDYTAPVSRNRTILEGLRRRAVFLDKQGGNLLESRGTTLPLETVVCLAARQVTSTPFRTRCHGRRRLLTSRRPARAIAIFDALAYILYTSGSTGIPKGVHALAPQRHQLRRLVLDQSSRQLKRIGSAATRHFISICQSSTSTCRSNTAPRYSSISEDLGKSPKNSRDLSSGTD